ncbi:MAG: hypothetical protein CMM01_22485 [Rhodopirellula sp.]|nr:hypothetical protein [Rhodopirellula sp.]OUX49398.1 MAG: hypothetical protein CBE43_10220 [Rhodopirellula sp. TMED283]
MFMPLFAKTRPLHFPTYQVATERSINESEVPTFIPLTPLMLPRPPFRSVILRMEFFSEMRCDYQNIALDRFGKGDRFIACLTLVQIPGK